MLLEGLGNLVHRDILGRHSRDLHSDVGQSFLDSVVDNVCLRVDDDSDTALAVQIRDNAAILSDDLLEAADAQLLADDGDHVNERFFDALGCIFDPGLFHECIDACGSGLQCLISDLCDVIAELLVLSDKVCLGVDFDDCCYLVAFLGDEADTFCSDSAGFLLSFGLTLFAENLNSGIHIAVGLSEGLLAVHHARAGSFAKFFNLCSCNCHNLYTSRSFITFTAGRSQPAAWLSYVCG